MTLKPKVKKILIYTAVSIMVIALLSFVETKQQSRLCRQIDVVIEEGAGNYFINNTDVISLVNNSGRDAIIGSPQNKIHLKSLEQRIRTNKFVKDCQVSRDLHGDLLINIHQYKPIARIVNPLGQDFYVSETGELLPMSERYTARVITVHSANPEKTWINGDWLKRPENLPYLQLLQFIYKNKFWKTLLAGIEVNNEGEINFYPQIGKQIIEFGIPENEEIIKEKFKKLGVFYNKIISSKSWNRYKKVNVSYKNQIICE